MINVEHIIRKFRLLESARSPLIRTIFLISLALTTSCGREEPGRPDPAGQEYVWVTSLLLDPDSKITFIGKSKQYLVTTVAQARDLTHRTSIKVGDEIEGIRVGAIRCSFFSRDASYGGKQFMWRGRWGCMVGRSKDEIENAVGPDGEKRHEYLSVSPVSRIK